MARIFDTILKKWIIALKIYVNLLCWYFIKEAAKKLLWPPISVRESRLVETWASITSGEENCQMLKDLPS